MDLGDNRKPESHKPIAISTAATHQRVEELSDTLNVSVNEFACADEVFPASGMLISGNEFATPHQASLRGPGHGPRHSVGYSGPGIGRHTYRSLLDETGAPIGVQQKLMRHSNVATTMNVYGSSTLRAKQQANSKVVEMVMKQERSLAEAV